MALRWESNAAGAGKSRKRSAPASEDWQRPTLGSEHVRSTEGWGIRARMVSLCCALAVGLGYVAGSGFTLTVTDGEDWRALAEKQRKRRLHVQPKRGTLYDRNGGVLAGSVEVPSVSVDAVELLRDKEGQEQVAFARMAAGKIAAALDLDPAKIESKISSNRRFIWLKRRVSSEEAQAIRELGQSDQGDERIRGLIVEGEGKRYYPRRELAAPLLGFVAPDGEGKDGIELALNQELKGHPEKLQGLRDRRGRLLLSEGTDSEHSFSGNSVSLTIDQGIQFVAERELAMAARTYEAKAGSVVVVEPSTGEVLAMASWPTFNPNDYRQSSPEQRRNRAVSDRYEPGSTMKIFTVAAGMAEGVTQATDKLYCEEGRMAVDNIVIRDTHPSKWLTVSQVLAQSSNICAAKIGLSLGGQRLYESLLRFGFGQPTGLEITGETAGVLRPRNRPWVQVETASAAFGQGISVSTLQLAMATGAIANGGTLLEPRLIKRVQAPNGELLREATPRVRRRAVPKAVARAVAEMMVAVTEGDGTGVSAAIDGFQVAGKTATAQKIDPLTGRYSLDNYIASFVGFVPARNPVVAIAVMVDEPMVAHSGGEVAAPIFRRVAEVALKSNGLRSADKVTQANIKELARQADPAAATLTLLQRAQGVEGSVQETELQGRLGPGQVRVPDMTGWPIRRALVKAQSMGIRPRVTGHGLVTKQVPSPGQAIDKGGTLTLSFEPAS